ncbi:MAG: c-type cytochrome [Thermoanaerobaculales bacterium]|nr:c-type cytochrome [Thermoanaerobaculales bacterium]
MFDLKATTRGFTFPPILVLGGLLIFAATAAADDGLQTGKAIYTAACSSCHGANGRGAPPSLVGFPTPVPDFTDCDFANREPDSDWVGIAYEGGPSRGFSEHMPAFQGVLTVEQVQLAVNHIRTFCADDRWPRGELNLPRALITGKAFPEDEAVITTLIDAEGEGSILNKLVYEQRFGPRSQWEIVVPFGWLETDNVIDDDGTNRWTSSMGDIALAVKHTVHHSHEKGSIVSVAGELILPTGDAELGFGNGTTVFEPFVVWGQILPADFFLQTQLGLELTADKDKAENAAFLRAALGWTTTTGEFGRAWSPIVELTAGREFATDADINYSIVPQIQITLNKRQHIMFNIGLRAPLNNRDTRTTQVVFYVLWDWFDGTLFEGW